jgi:hypothetical protein
MAIDTISFPTFDPVTGFPTIDGFTGNLDPGVITTSAEAGYAVGGRLTWGGGAGYPPFAYQCVHANITNPAAHGLSVSPGHYLILGFFCTYDYSFDLQDGIVICLTPDETGSDHSRARRIDLFPLRTNIGAGEASQPENTPNFQNPGDNYHARLDRAPRAATFYRGLSDGTWESIAVTASNFHSRAASWVPSTQAATSVGTQTISSTASPFNVSDGSRFPAGGGAFTAATTGGGTITVSFTERSGNTLNGCRAIAGSGGTVGPGTTIRLVDGGWSVELLIPMSAANGSPDTWVDIPGRFRMYFNLLRYGATSPPGVNPPQGAYNAQYRFPIPDVSDPGDPSRLLTGVVDSELAVPLGWYGVAEVPAITGTNTGEGVRFANESLPELSVGVRHPGSGMLTGTIYGSSGPSDNELVAMIESNDASHSFSGVTAEFRFAKWGIPSPAWGDWDPASSHGAGAASSVSLPAAPSGGVSSAEITQSWPRSSVPADYAANMGHHCMWVRLDSPNAVNFVQAGARRNLNFAQLSEHEATATVSGKGYNARGTMEMLLLPHVRQIGFWSENRESVRTYRETDLRRKGIAGWVVVVESLLRTDEWLEIEGVKSRVCDPSPGQFALVALHDDPKDVMHFRLEGKELRGKGGGYVLRLEADTEVELRVRARTTPEGEVGFEEPEVEPDRPEDTDKPDKPGENDKPRKFPPSCALSLLTAGAALAAPFALARRWRRR